MKNRLESYTKYSDFSSYSAFSNLDLYTGEIELKKIVDAYIEERIEQARQEGYRQAGEDFGKALSGAIRTEIDGYINLVTRIAGYVYEKSKEIFKNELTLIETRTNFYFGTKRIKLLFIIDTTFEKILEFSNLLNGVEKEVFEKDSFLCELLYVNKRDASIDEPSINYDFPLVRTRDNKK